MKLCHSVERDDERLHAPVGADREETVAAPQGMWGLGQELNEWNASSILWLREATDGL